MDISAAPPPSEAARGRGWLVRLAVAFVVAGSVCLLSAGFARADEPTPEQDDAALHALHFLGPRTGWVVGDRGVIWKTADSGQSWRLLPCPTPLSVGEVHWNSVCFLTDRIGWIAGGGTTPYGRQNAGYLMGTRDGGETWQPLIRANWPRLRHVQFFDLENGVAVCDESPLCPSGILMTTDGGQSWLPSAGESPRGWRAGTFTSPHQGIVCGLRGDLAYVAESGLQSNSLNQFGLRGLHAVSLAAEGQGWLVGDGGTVQKTGNAGVNWVIPDQPVPKTVRDTMNFRAVAHRGERVWIAGSPGSVVLHSPDAGRSWVTQRTSQPAPLHAIQFVSDRHGFAVGDLGRIAATEDGGETWTELRGDDRRVAVLSFHVRPREVSLPLIVRTAGEWGYRGAAHVLSREDIGDRHPAGAATDDHLRDALLRSGASSATIGWRLPITIPGLDSDRDRLTREWSLLTEQRLGEVLLNELVAAIRMWRPDVLVTNESGVDDIPGTFLREALDQAVEMAADPRRFSSHAEDLNLSPWAVAKMFVRQPSGAEGTVTLDPHEILPRAGSTLQSASASAIAILREQADVSVREGYQLAYSAPELKGREGIDRSLFAGLNLPPGSPPRRKLPPLKEIRFEELERLAQKQRQFEVALQLSKREPRIASGMLARLDETLRGLSPADAAKQIAELAREYRQQRDWSLAESAYSRLIDLYPHEPVSQEGARWLLSCWTSEEVAWQRLRSRQANRQELASSDGSIRQTRLELTQGDPRSILSAAKADIAEESATGANRPSGEAADRNSLERERWQKQAGRLESFLRETSPALLSSPEVQFTLAAHWRQARQHQLADRVYDRFVKGARSPWNRAALGEIWLLQPATLSPKPVADCRRTPVPPHLDGRLDDAAWGVARPIPLLSPGAASQGDSFVGSRSLKPAPAGGLKSTDERGNAEILLAYDDKYLYVAGRLPCVEGLSDEGPSHAGREHDEDLSPFDRVTVCLDIDRDYGTAYRLDVDQRGHTRDACWEDQGWDPKWHVACARDERAWVFEAAIPFEELVPSAPKPGGAAVWGLGLIRTIPAIGTEAWTHPCGEPPQPASFGLLRFE